MDALGEERAVEAGEEAGSRRDRRGPDADFEHRETTSQEDVEKGSRRRENDDPGAGRRARPVELGFDLRAVTPRKLKNGLASGFANHGRYHIR